MKPGISIQLYSLREASADNFDKVLSDVANIGYQGVEPFNLFDKSAQEFRQQVTDLGMVVSSSHYPWANRVDPSSVIDTLAALGLNRAIGGFAPADFATLSAIQRTAEQTLVLQEKLAKQSISLCLHNHWWEFEIIDGEPGYHYFQELVPTVEFELDTYWTANFGTQDPAIELARIAKRTPLLHIKDGPLVKEKAHVAVGSGKMDIPAVLASADPETLQWAVVELDSCDTDMIQAVTDSYRYLVDNNLVREQA